MNYKLLALFLLVELIEFTVFWAIASLVVVTFGGSTLSVFLFLVGVDIILTVLTYNKQIAEFVAALSNKEDT
jgi:hypothetical protein